MEDISTPEIPRLSPSRRRPGPEVESRLPVDIESLPCEEEGNGHP